MQNKNVKRVISAEAFIFLGLLIGFFTLFASKMGFINMLSTMMNTSFRLLIDTCLYIMAIAVVAGGIAGLMQEFGLISLIDRLVSPIMRPIFGLPGATSIGAITTYLSDNPSILALANDESYKRYFKKYQLPALTNLGTGFGMGAIITTYVMGFSALGKTSYVLPAIIGNLGALIGSIVSTRIMLSFTKKIYGTEAQCEISSNLAELSRDYRPIRPGSAGSRFLGAMLDGGATGVKLGFDIIPGVLIICTFVMMLTGKASESGAYTGAAYEGISLLPAIGEKISFLLKPLFGFQSSGAIAVPITALGSAGAALGIIKGLVTGGFAGPHDAAVFTAMCMCWSGYLSTHVAMMSSLKESHLTGKAILSHTIGGLCAGISAHLIYSLISLIAK